MLIPPKFTILSALFFLAASVTMLAQTDKLKFLETEYNFGTVNEKGGQVTHRFKFINEGTEAVKVQTAKASCGCTTPSWSNNPVFPGDTGFIEARYNPDNRPGNFNKHITVYFEKTTFNQVFNISGYVQPPLGNPTSIYKFNIGNLRFKSKYLNMGMLDANKSTTKVFTVYNQHSAPMRLEAPKDLPKHISIQFEPQTILSQQVGNIRITYNAEIDQRFGMIYDKISIKTNDNITPTKTLNMSAQVQEYFTDSMKTDPNRPILTFDKIDKYVGSLTEGEVVTVEFTYKNAGNSPLLIRSVYSSCECLATKSNKKKLKPGATGTIKVTFDSSNKVSYINNSVTMITNDPNTPIQKVTVRAKVVPKPASK